MSYQSSFLFEKPQHSFPLLAILSALHMFLSMSNEVVSLKRIAFAHIVLDEQLKYGQYRQLNEDEMKLLQNALA